MKSIQKHLLSPRQLGQVFLIPLVIPIACSALLLFGLCELIGADSSLIVGNYLVEALMELSPLIRFLLTAWLFYVLFIYGPIAYASSLSSFITVKHAVESKAFALSPYSVLVKNIYPSNPLPLSERVQALFCVHHAEHLAIGWHPSTDPQIE